MRLDAEPAPQTSSVHSLLTDQVWGVVQGRVGPTNEEAQVWGGVRLALRGVLLPA